MTDLPRFDPNADPFAGFDEDEARRKAEARKPQMMKDVADEDHVEHHSPPRKPPMQDYTDEDHERMPPPRSTMRDYEDEDFVRDEMKPPRASNDVDYDNPDEAEFEKVVPPLHGNGADELPKATGISADELCAKVFAPVKFVVPGYIVEGLTLFCGKPKAGKSWLALHFALAVPRGGFTLGDVHCPEGDALYLALEDNWRRIQRRLLKLLGSEPAPKRLTIMTEMPRLAEGGLKVIRDWIEHAKKPRLVVVDVLAKVRDRNRKDQGLYDADYTAMQGLKALADEFGIAIVVVHHLRKLDADDPLDQISGTTGLTGCADSVLILHKSNIGTTLKGRGRDLEEIDKAIQFNKDSFVWTITGEASEVAQQTGRGAILFQLREASAPLSPQEIADLCNLTKASARKLLTRMERDGEVIKIGRGQYVHPDRR
jgi:hypothetical protein